jgi:hypothetical protein
VRAGVRRELQPRVLELEPVRFHGHGRLGFEQGDDGRERFLGHAAFVAGLQAEHGEVGAEGAGADTEHRPAARQVVEHDEAVGDHERVMQRQVDHA